MALEQLNAFLRSAAATCQQAKKELKLISDLDRRKKLILDRVCVRLIPFVRREIAIAYAQSGLREVGQFKPHDGDNPGDMHRAAMNATIVRTAKGLVAKFASGFNPHVYARGGAFEYGATYGNASAKAKRKIKAQAGGQSQVIGGGYRTQAARPFFRLASDQLQRLQAIYVRLWNEEANK